MKKYIILLLTIIAFLAIVATSSAQIKVQALPTVTTGLSSDYLLKDKTGAGGTQIISVKNFIQTYSITAQPSLSITNYSLTLSNLIGNQCEVNLPIGGNISSTSPSNAGYIPAFITNSVTISNTSLYYDGTNTGINKVSGLNALLHINIGTHAGSHFTLQMDNDHGPVYAFRDDGFLQMYDAVGHRSYFGDAGAILQFGSADAIPITFFSSNNSSSIWITSADNPGKVGINQTSPTAQMHIQGVGSTSADYAFKADNSSASQLLYIRDDGAINCGAGTIVTLAAGTTTSAPFVFTSGSLSTTPSEGYMEYENPSLWFTNKYAIRQEIPQIQQSSVAATFTVSSTLTNVPLLTANCKGNQPGKQGTYRFEANLYTVSDVAAGVKFQVSISGANVSQETHHITYIDDASKSDLISVTVTDISFTSAYGVTATTGGYCQIVGTLITSSSDITLTVQVAENVNNTTRTQVLVGSTFIVTQLY